MSVGFGFSVGDFLAGLELVGTIIDALRESGASSTAFRSLINELYALESAFLRVKRLDLDEQLQIQQLALRQAAAQCQRSIDGFWQKVQLYQPHLQTNGTGSKLKDGWAKIKWAVCKKEDLANFRAEVRGHTSSTEILLMTIQMEATQLGSKQSHLGQKTLGDKMEVFSSEVMTRLGTLDNGVSATTQQRDNLLQISTQIVETNLRVFQMLHDIQSLVLKIPGQVQRQQPIYFTDPFNRVCPFHLEFIRSVDAFLSVLRANFREAGVDSNMLDNGEFVIEDEGTSKSIDISRAWDSCFFPG